MAMAGYPRGNAQFESNLPHIQASMPLGSTSVFVTQLVLTNTSSFRTPPNSGSMVRKDLPKFPQPRLLVHSVWPSLMVTNGNKVEIYSLTSLEPARLTYCRPDRLVSTQGLNSISYFAFDLIRNIWIPLVEGVSDAKYMTYCWFKHVRFHGVPALDNVWDRSLFWAGHVIGTSFSTLDTLMYYLLYVAEYKHGKTYLCWPFADLVTKHFFNHMGVTVNLIFFTHNGVRYWKEVRILLEDEMNGALSYPPSCLFDVEDTDLFVFEVADNRVL